MSKIIQIRDVPNDVHRRLKARAAMAGMSLSEFLCREISALARRPALAELLERIKRRGAASGGLDSPAAVRSERESR